MKKHKKELDNVKCPNCGYSNLKYNVQKYGTCTGCRQVLDEKARFKHEMYERLRLWRKK